MEGFCKTLVKLLGPVHIYDPPATAVAVSVKVLPLQTGPLFPATGAAGGIGSVRVNGPAGLEGHPFNTTTILVYVAAVNPETVSTPAASDVNDVETGVPF